MLIQKLAVTKYLLPVTSTCSYLLASANTGHGTTTTMLYTCIHNTGMIHLQAVYCELINKLIRITKYAYKETMGFFSHHHFLYKVFLHINTSICICPCMEIKFGLCYIRAHFYSPSRSHRLIRWSILIKVTS